MNIVIKTAQVVGSNKVIYSAWEPSSLTGRHHVITFIDGVCYGQVGRTRIGDEIEAMPGGSAERIEACRAHRERDCARAYAAITSAYPNLEIVRCDDGEIWAESKTGDFAVAF